ncbi:Pseudaminic acid synthase [Piscirickettsia salmonis]|uniref:Pseudaminic acid synthase n=1 Tax=Piscirickettsia salmonis TaxID=1238 RepID=A0A9Q6PRM1_PISSA|nr:pseudaminic acid synthase [Piscirickettsia salmonis]QGN93912.1 Pseudaminic acid synthase [Piscirickettsia salmonis]QGO04855.1 Pseudaminic acid synthase [Piscirickettsia salmonis]QGO33176.1 Pseudaminic acid synthase [Piscirickettsia salmonis]QGO36788.1 Pseudaminic acid synthase [Piscirickettsia salmonis]QGO40412.1 Pseudaminic acid synthase [Piscirickettsia salmonis]
MFKIGNYEISRENKPFIIAEMSGNHNNSLDRALEIVEAAAKAGADAIKLQTYTADTMTLDIDKDDFKIMDKNSLWYGQHLYELYQQANTPWEWHETIFNKAKELGILCFSSPFDSTAVDFLEELNAPAYKIASFENKDVNLIRKVAKTGKPVIISTGMASLADLHLITETLRESGCTNFILLKCTSAYPASPADANLVMMARMGEIFDCQVGLSDHTMGVGVPIAAVALGATVIEKHFCLSRKEGGVDADFSLEPHEFSVLVEEAKKAWQSIGSISYQLPVAEEKSKQFRRSIYFVKDMQSGEVITEECVRCIRPGYGLEPQYWDKVIGCKVRRKVVTGDRVEWECLEF